MRPRFYAPEIRGVGEPVTLPDEEAQHVRQVLRLRAGDAVSVFDGRGREFAGTIERMSRRAVTVHPLEAVVPAPEPSVSVTVAPVVLKGRAFDAVVRDAAMLGVVAVQPLLAAHQLPHGSAPRRPGAASRWRRLAVSAAKQSRRAVVPEVRDAIDAATLIATERSALRLVLCEPAAGRQTVRLRGPVDARPTSVSLAIGPEGGWTPEELDRFAAGGWTFTTGC